MLALYWNLFRPTIDSCYTYKSDDFALFLPSLSHIVVKGVS